MTNRRLVAATLAALVGVTGCTDLSEEVVTGVTASFFATPQGADAAITGTYNRLRDYYGQEREVLLGQVGTDSWEKGGELNANTYLNDYTSQLSPTAAAEPLQNHWSNSYQAIDAANTAIAAIEGSTAIPDAQKAIRLGEARFLRALFYHNLVRTWGAVHLQLEPTQGVQTVATRTAPAEIYAQAIVPDLEFAIANLPATQTQFGRATRGAAQALLAEVLLTRGAQGDFDRVRDVTTQIINSGAYTLNPSFVGLFCGPPRAGWACDFVAANEQNREFIWSVQFNGDGVQDQWGNSLHLYYTMAYDVQGAPDLVRTVEYGRPYRRLRPTMHLLGLWNRAADTRYESTFQTLWQSVGGARDTAIFLTSTPTVPAANQGKRYRAFGESNYSPTVFPVLRKWLDQTRANPNQTFGQRDRHLWRLADVYLMRAEANIRAGRVNDAVADFNVLRRRAARPGMETANELSAAERTALTANALDFLLDERERELAGEELRWYTLTRLGKLVDRVQRFNPGAASNIRAHHALRPIPQTQIDRTEGGGQAFAQNPGY